MAGKKKRLPEIDIDEHYRRQASSMLSEASRLLLWDQTRRDTFGVRTMPVDSARVGVADGR